MIHPNSRGIAAQVILIGDIHWNLLSLLLDTHANCKNSLNIPVFDTLKSK
jgi:hypothetical protein